MGRIKRAVAGTLAGILVGGAGACASHGADGAGLPVVVGFYPLQFVVERVGGDRVHVTNLAQPGAEPHDLELSPRQVGSITDAKLVLYLRGFQPALDGAVDQAGTPALDAAGVVPLLPGAAGEEGEQGMGADPHVWLDPQRLSSIATALAGRLAELDPSGERDYRARATALAADLATLDRQYSDGLGDCARREIVVSHAAFGYLADRYDLHQIPIAGLSPDTEPTPEQLAIAAEDARQAGATTIFFETLVSPDVARTVADEIGADTAVLDPVEGLEPGSTGDYFSVMRDNLTSLRTALECA